VGNALVRVMSDDLSQVTNNENGEKWRNNTNYQGDTWKD